MKVTNTEKRAKENPGAVLGEHLALGSSNAIEASEARGQRELVASSVLPRQFNWCTREEFEALGFVFGEDVADDPLFRNATLPDGWRREGSDHAMWSYLLDQHGRRRVGVFYKAAFYDRKAHMSFMPRFASEERDGHWIVIDNALGTVAHDGGVKSDGYPDDAYSSCSAFIDARRKIDGHDQWPAPVGQRTESAP